MSGKGGIDTFSSLAAGMTSLQRMWCSLDRIRADSLFNIELRVPLYRHSGYEVANGLLKQCFIIPVPVYGTDATLYWYG